jgi:hypothetical protein
MIKLKLLISIGIISLALIVLFSPNFNASTKTQFDATPLTDASTNEISQAAIDYTYYRFTVVSGSPEVLLVQSVTKNQIPSLGLSAIEFAGEEPPMALVAIKGDFDVSSLRAVGSPLQVQYLIYIIDLKVGLPTLIEFSVDGSRFRDLLNDPSLPEYNQPPSDPNEPMATPESETAAPKLPYGSVVPTVESPKVAPSTEK